MTDRDRRDAAPTYSAAELGRLLDGLTPQRMTQLVQQGVLKRVERGRYDLFESVVGYVRMLKARLVRKDAGRSEDDPKNNKARSDAERARIELETLKGERLVAADVFKVVDDCGATINRLLHAVPSKVAPLCIGRKATEIQVIISDAINEALIELRAIGDKLGA